uniref:Uncharacterized protein n=1 Tax=Amphora coffeiformis TaxID=265554 RepID=A0A7S3L9L5_9STRA
MLRDLVAWEEESALKMAWSFLDSRLQVLEEYIQSNEGYHRVMNAENLIFEAEDFVAVMGLFRLWYMVRKMPTGVPDLDTRLARVVQAISYTISTTQSPTMFRLSLLENATQLVLDWPDKGAMDED